MNFAVLISILDSMLNDFRYSVDSFLVFILLNGGVLAGEGFDEDEGKVTEIYWIDIM